jgi:CubicO group peptidase (beta-lactamase class C family)
MASSFEDLVTRHPAVQQLDRSVDAGAPGFAAAVIERGSTVGSIYRGLANLEWGTPIGPDTRFHAASLAKQFTALAVLQLRDRGLLALDTPVAVFIPELADGMASVNLRHLLTHTSGLRDQWPLMEWAGWRGNDVITTDDVTSMILRQTRPQFEPGTHYMYSNSGYTLLGQVVARAAGCSFATYATCEIFTPLGMESTLIAGDPSAVLRRRADAYRFDRDANAYRMHSPQLFVHGATSLVTTLDDYMQWMRAHRDGSPWRIHIDEMQQPHHLADGSAIPNGLAYVLDTDNERPVAFHAGEDLGFSSFFAHYPDDDAAVAILANSSLENLRSVAADLISGAGVLRSGTARSEPGTVPGNEAPAPRVVLGEDISTYTGAYVSELGEVRRIERRDDEMFVIWGVERRLLPTARGRFLTETGDEYVFSTDGGCRILELMQKPALGRRRWVHVAAELREERRLVTIPQGRYFSEATGTLLDIVAGEDGHVTLLLPKRQRAPLESLGDNLYSAGALWLRCWRENGRTRLYLSEPRCLDVEYEKCANPC